MKARFVSTLLVLTVGLIFNTVSLAATKVVEQTFESKPHLLVQKTTVDVIAAVEGGKLDPAKDPQKFVNTLTEILDPIVAFERIAKGVMGKHAKGVEASEVKRFSESFKLGLVNTYGKGLSGFGDLVIKVLPPEVPVDEAKRILVVQELKGQSSTNQVVYTMRVIDGNWKMTNIKLNGVNLGKTFRSQFAAAVKENKGDVVKTINEWGKS